MSTTFPGGTARQKAPLVVSIGRLLVCTPTDAFVSVVPYSSVTLPWTPNISKVRKKMRWHCISNPEKAEKEARSSHNQKTMRQKALQCQSSDNVVSTRNTYFWWHLWHYFKWGHCFWLHSFFYVTASVTHYFLTFFFWYYFWWHNCTIILLLFGSR